MPIEAHMRAVKCICMTFNFARRRRLLGVLAYEGLDHSVATSALRGSNTLHVFRLEFRRSDEDTLKGSRTATIGRTGPRLHRLSS